MKHLIRTTFEICTPEDAEFGECSERGWIDEEGESMDLDPDFDDMGDDTVHKKTVTFLRDKGACHPNNSDVADSWSDNGGQDSNWETRSYFLVGYSDKELKLIHEDLES
jgi:hypothetical protein